MNLIKKYIEYIGLSSGEDEDIVIPNYEKIDNIEIARYYLKYLKELDCYHEKRLEGIESKNSQLVGQAGLMISIAAIGVPLFLDKLGNMPFQYFIPLSCVFILVLSHFVLSIIHSTRTLDISQYPYQSGSVTTVTRPSRAQTEIELINEEIEDLISGIKKNSSLTDFKGGNLLYSARTFKLASIYSAAFIIMVMCSSYFIPRIGYEEYIKNEVDRKVTDILLNKKDVKVVIGPQISDSLKEKYPLFNGPNDSINTQNNLSHKK